jgi:hypothetical protein
MSVYNSEDWRIDVAAITPSVITSAPVGQPTVRLLLTHGCVAMSVDLPARAAVRLAKSFLECADASAKAYAASYGAPRDEHGLTEEQYPFRVGAPYEPTEETLRAAAELVAEVDEHLGHHGPTTRDRR